jgi:Ca2+-binding EF-hand superfamily protein
MQARRCLSRYHLQAVYHRCPGAVLQSELEKIHEEMDRDEQDRQKAQRFADHLEREP